MGFALAGRTGWLTLSNLPGMSFVPLLLLLLLPLLLLLLLLAFTQTQVDRDIKAFTACAPPRAARPRPVSLIPCC